MKLDLDNQEVTVVPVKVQAVRDWFDDKKTAFHDELITALDGAQGFVFSGEGPVSYVVIEINK